jgi:hypothetical protein
MVWTTNREAHLECQRASTPSLTPRLAPEILFCFKIWALTYVLQLHWPSRLSNKQTIRVYSINPDLNHDICMSMLATAGIYLVLDVNSPRINQHINRYEPWLTYNTDYLEHVFKVVEQFAQYNNTLGFFAGNEIVNDRVSAKVRLNDIVNDVQASKLTANSEFSRLHQSSDQRYQVLSRVQIPSQYPCGLLCCGRLAVQNILVKLP